MTTALTFWVVARDKAYLGRRSLDSEFGWVGFEHAYTFSSEAAAVESAERFGGSPALYVR